MTLTENMDTEVESIEPINILCIVDDPVIKKKAAAYMWQYFIQSINLPNIVYVPKIKGSTLTLNNYQFSGDQLKSMIDIPTNTISSIQDLTQTHFEDKKFTVFIFDEPKLNTLMMVLAYRKNFPQVNFVNYKQLNNITEPLEKLVTVLSSCSEEEDCPSFEDLPFAIQKHIRLNSQNHIPPGNYSVDGWPYAFRFLFNILMLEQCKTISVSVLKHYKEKYGVRVDLTKAFNYCCSPLNPKLHLFTTDHYPQFDEHMDFKVDTNKLQNILIPGVIPQSAFCPLLTVAPYIYYNAYVKTNREAFIDFLTTGEEKHEAFSVITKNDEDNKCFFDLNPNLPFWAYMSENPADVKMSQQHYRGEYLIDGKSGLPNKYRDNLETFSLGLDSVKINLSTLLNNFRGHVVNWSQHISNVAPSSYTETDFFFMNKMYTVVNQSKNFESLVSYMCETLD